MFEYNIPSALIILNGAMPTSSPANMQEIQKKPSLYKGGWHILSRDGMIDGMSKTMQ